jgi:hypothetical protein
MVYQMGIENLDFNNRVIFVPATPVFAQARNCKEHAPE